MTLAILATAAIILIFGEPYEESRTWYSDFFFQKALGVPVRPGARIDPQVPQEPSDKQRLRLP